MNPLRQTLNKYKFTTGFSKILIHVDTHGEEIEKIPGTSIIDVNPMGFTIGDLEIPYHRVQLVFDGDQIIYSKNQKWAGQYGDE